LRAPTSYSLFPYTTLFRSLWFGTYGNGLNRLKDGKFIRYTTKDGLLDHVVSQILEDDRGNFWITGNKGIYRLSKKELDDFAEGKDRKSTRLNSSHVAISYA